MVAMIYCWSIVNYQRTRTDEKLEQFLKNIIQYKFREIPTDNNPLILLAKRTFREKRDTTLLVKGYFIVWKL